MSIECTNSNHPFVRTCFDNSSRLLSGFLPRLVAVVLSAGLAVPAASAQSPRRVLAAAASKTATTTTIDVSPSSNLEPGKPFTLTIAVAPVTGTGIPSGTVALEELNSGYKSTLSLGSNGTAVYNGMAPGPDTYKLSATYNGSAMMASSSSPVVTVASTPPAPSVWTNSGNLRTNSRYQPTEQTISRSTAHNLSMQWSFTTGGYVSATPTVDATAVYFPDSAGNLYALARKTGAQIWTHKMSDYTGVAKAISRVSPAIDNGHLFLGDQLGQSTVRPGADVLSVDAATGKLLWITSVESHVAAQITGSPVIVNGTVYIGVSSGEEGLAESNTYPCCTFRGSVVALDENTGKILWKTYMVPDNGGKPGGYSGNAVWSAPAIDTHRNSIYVATGNNYTAPASVIACQNANPTEDCSEADDYFDSVVSLDLFTGAIKWGKRLQGFDIYTLACKTKSGTNPNCPVPSSPDFDFGSGPNYIHGTMVGVGQKSGIYWALNADNGDVIWSTPVGPSGSLGGMIWGTSTDDVRIYANIGNDHNTSFKLASGATITWGAFSALDARTGTIIWQTADPIAGTIDATATSTANGVVFTGSYSGHMYALNSASGQILWDFNSGGTVIDGPSIVDGTLFWGSGYHGPGTTNNKLYAFSIPGTM